MVVFNKEKFLLGLKRGKYSIEDASKSLRDDEEVIMTVASMSDVNGMALKMASKRLRKDDAFVESLIAVNGYELQSALPKYRDRESIVISALSSHSDIFYCISDRLKNNDNFVFQCVTSNGYILKNAPMKYQRDRDYALAAVRNQGLMYRYLIDEYKKDYGIAKAAVSQEGYTYHFLLNNLKQSKELTVLSLQNGNEYSYYIYKDEIPEKYRHDKDVSLVACNADMASLSVVPQDVFENKSFRNGLTDIVNNNISLIMNNSEQTDGENQAQADEYYTYVKSLIEQKENMIMEERALGNEENQCLDSKPLPQTNVSENVEN